MCIFNCGLVVKVYYCIYSRILLYDDLFNHANVVMYSVDKDVWSSIHVLGKEVELTDGEGLLHHLFKISSNSLKADFLKKCQILIKSL